MHFDINGIIGLYGELAFGIVCTFWIIHEIEVRWFGKKP